MSKATKQGMALAKEAQVQAEKWQDGVYTAGAPQGGVQGGAQAVMFRRKFDARDPMDDEMNTKIQLMDKDGMTPFGQVFYDDKVGRWLERKAATAEAANFDRYFAQNFNKNDLASRQWAQKINPDWYKQREDEMNERANMVVKLKAIQLRGPQSKEDLYMLWLIETGRVVLPADWDRIAPGVAGKDVPNEAGNLKNWWASLIRLPLFLTTDQKKARATENQRAGAWGSPATSSNFFSTGPNTGNNGPLARGGNTMSLGFLKELEQAL